MIRALVVAGVFVGVAAATVGAGGWAVTTIDRVPDFAVAGQPFQLGFTVRQHGHSLVSGLKGPIRARLGERIAEAQTRPGATPGTYLADVTLATTGTWAVEIEVWGRTVVDVPVVRSAADAKTIPQDEQGRRLFAAKGCVTCHVHQAADTSTSIGYGPDLTGRRYPVELLEMKLVRPAPCGVDAFTKPCMPALGLADHEVRALGAFLNGSGAHVAASVSAGGLGRVE